MARQQTEAGSKEALVTGGLQYLTRELIREPVREAVREALREEADVSGDGKFADATPPVEPADDDGRRGGPSLVTAVVGLVVVGGVAYVLRKRRSETEQSTWSEFDDESTGTTDFARESESLGTGAATPGESNPSSSSE